MIPQGRERSKSGHEHKDADVFGVALVAALVLLIVAISFLAAQGLLRFSESDQKPRPRSPAPRAQFPEPRLQVHPAADLAATLRTSKAELHSYGWIDRGAGVVRMPIERAMQLLLERGLPEVGAGQTPLQLLQARPSTDTQPEHPVGSPTPEGSPS